MGAPSGQAWAAQVAWSSCFWVLLVCLCHIKFCPMSAGWHNVSVPQQGPHDPSKLSWLQFRLPERCQLACKHYSVTTCKLPSEIAMQQLNDVQQARQPVKHDSSALPKVHLLLMQAMSSHTYTTCTRTKLVCAAVSQLCALLCNAVQCCCVVPCLRVSLQCRRMQLVQAVMPLC